MANAVLVTGISGFIAKHVALELLKGGYSVQGTLRSLDRAGAVRKTLAAHGADVSRLTFAAADLDRDEGWAEAVSGCAFVQHIASPFPLQQPSGREDLVPAARQGALRVLAAARVEGVERVVMTSSMVAMMYRAGRPAEMQVGESDWTDPDWKAATPYIISKTRAERSAWDYVSHEWLRERLVAVNPGFVLGPALDGDIGTSLQALGMILKGAYPAVPPVDFPIVDVRDLARLQVAAMAPAVGGRRLIAAGETWSMAQMAQEMRAAHPARARRIPVRVLPAAAVKVLSLFDASLRTLGADLGVRPVGDSAYVTQLTGVEFRRAAEAVRAASRSLIEHGLA